MACTPEGVQGRGDLELLSVKSGESSGSVCEALGLDGVSLEENVEGFNICQILSRCILIDSNVAPDVPEGQLAGLYRLYKGKVI